MKKLKKLNLYIQYCGLKFVIFAFCAIPRPIARFIGYLIAIFMFYIVPVRKKTVIEGLQIAFPQKTIQEINKIAKSVYLNFINIFLDLFFISQMPGDKVEKMLIYDKKIIDGAMDRGKGLVLLSAHFGNWELSGIAFSKNHPTITIIAESSNPHIDKMLDDFRGSNNIKVRRDDKTLFKDIVKNLRNNRALTIVGDQDAGYRGLFLPFFGRMASTPKGPAVFALHAGCPIITAFGVRQKDGSMKMKIQELPLPNTGDKQEDIKIINTIYYQRLEEAIKENPEQWFWFHRRWKSRPPAND